MFGLHFEIVAMVISFDKHASIYYSSICATQSVLMSHWNTQLILSSVAKEIIIN